MDDDDDVRDVLEVMLTTAGYAVTGAADGESAVGRYEDARKAREPFDAVILDLTVRGGSQLVRWARLTTRRGWSVRARQRAEVMVERIRLRPNHVLMDHKQHLFPAAADLIRMQELEVSGTVRRVGLDHLWTRI